MNRNSQRALCSLIAALAISALATSPVRADTQQTNKNQWRNAAIAAAAATAYGAHNHDKVTTLLGAAGTAYSASRYEKERRSQSQARALRARRYHNANNINPSNQPPYGNANGYRRNHNSGQKHHGKGWYKNHGQSENDGDDHDKDHDRGNKHDKGNGHGHGDGDSKHGEHGEHGDH